MAEDMRAEVLEMCVNACEKHTSNNENAAKMVKEQLDKRYDKKIIIFYWARNYYLAWVA